MLTEALKDFPPFIVKIETFQVFDNGKSATLFLDPVSEPPAALTDLYSVLENTLPSYALARGFCAHIGIGFFKGKEKKDAERLKAVYQASWTPLTFRVDHLDINFRETQTTPFTSRQKIPLGSALSR